MYSAVYEYLNAAGHIGSDQTAGILFIVCAVATLGVCHMSYESVFLFLFGATPGKMLMKLRVVDQETLGRINYLQAYQRARGILNFGLFWYFLYPFLLPFSYLWASRREAQPWDTMAKTRVILKNGQDNKTK